MGVDAVKEGTIESMGAGIEKHLDDLALGEGISGVFGISGGDWRVLQIMLQSTLLPRLFAMDHRTLEGWKCFKWKPNKAYSTPN